MIEASMPKPPAQNLEMFSDRNTEILEMIAIGEPAAKIYDAIALMYEARNPGMRCSLLELKGNKLMHGGAPSLPKEYCEAVNGLENGPCVGSCGTSTYTGKRVLVENIETDPKWAAIKHYALPHGLSSCWSEPIKDTEGKVLGAFGMYYNYPAMPSDKELTDLASAGRLTSIVMDRDRREEKLRQSEFKYRTLVENLPQRFFIKDKDSTFVSCSKNLAEDLGISPDEFVGKTDFDYLQKEVAEAYRVQDRRIIESGQSEETEHLLTINGEEKHIHVVKAPAVDESGNVHGTLGIMWDITEQKLMEEKYLQAQKMESMGTLVGGVAHEFNNTLSGITGRLFLAKSDLENNPKVLRHLDIISKLSFRAADMIKQLLAFSRKSPVSMKPFDLSAFFLETYKLHKFSIPESIQLNAAFSDSVLPVFGDRSQVQQILVNLLHNARDAVESVKRPRISLSLERFEADEQFVSSHPDLTQQKFAYLQVKDNGCGISEEDRGKIFDPFYTTKEVGKGTGLGLAMVYGAVQTHNGIIQVDSELGKGTSVHIYLPISSPKLCEEDPKSTRQEIGAGECVLFVDDEVELRELGREVLESLGYKVLEASNGNEAIDVYNANKSLISLVVMDVVMPDMGGAEAATSIKSINDDVQVIFCTGYDGKDVLEEGMFEWADVISKPYEIEDFSQLIKKALSK